MNTETETTKAATDETVTFAVLAPFHCARCAEAQQQYDSLQLAKFEITSLLGRTDQADGRA